jgi:hypothetical protein
MTNDEEVPGSELHVRYRFQRGFLSFVILSAAHEASTASYFPKSFIVSLTVN